MGNVVLRDRRHLAQDGLIAIVVTVDTDELEIVSGPDIISRGFVYVKESEDLMEEIRDLSYESISDCLLSGADDWIQLKTKVKDDVSKFLYSKTKRNPMILPIIMEV